MKKLLIVATRQFWPTSTGHDVVMYHNCKGLAEKYGYEIHLCCFSDKHTDTEKELPGFIKTVTYLKLPNMIKSVSNAFIKSFIQCKYPLQNCLYYSKRSEEVLVKVYNEIKPDVLWIDMLRLASYAENFKNEEIIKILAAEDNLVKRYQRQLAANDSGNTAGYFSKNMSNIANKLISMQWLKRIILKKEMSLLNNYEKATVDYFDWVTFISEKEADEYNKKYNSEKAIAVTMGANVQYYAEEISEKKKPHTVSFMGNYSYAPNADSIQMICRDIMPKLPEDVQLYVIGNCPDELRKKIESSRVNVLGYVDDVRAALKSTEVFLSPITFGTGIKTKIIEAMAMGMPVVTNDVGAESLNVKNGEELFICNDAESIAETVTMLLNNEELRNTISQKAHDYALNNHDWDLIYKVYEKMGL